MNTLQVAADSPWLVHAAAATILYLHIAGGAVGIVSGTVAVAAGKGGRLHILAGRAFVIAMMVMASIGGFVAPFLVSAQGNPKLSDSIAGFFTCYLVATSWMTVRRKPGTTGRFEAAAFAFAALLAAAAIWLGTRTAGGGADYYALAGIIALAAALDLKVILGGGLSGAPRIARHLWRMCLAWFVAVGSFFLGQQRVMPEWVQGSPWLSLPPLAALALMLFWIVRVRFGKRLRRAFAALGGQPGAPFPGLGHPRRLVKDATE